MTKVLRSDEFVRWLDGLRDRGARIRIIIRIERMEDGNMGDVKSVGDGVFEARLTHGPGYRLYYTKRGAEIVVLLCGGDKASQRRDVARAKLLAEEWS